MSVQYTGGSGVQYNGEYSVHRGISVVQWRDIMSTLGSVQYTGDIKSTLGDIMTNVGEGHWKNN